MTGKEVVAEFLSMSAQGMLNGDQKMMADLIQSVIPTQQMSDCDDLTQRLSDSQDRLRHADAQFYALCAKMTALEEQNAELLDVLGRCVCTLGASSGVPSGDATLRAARAAIARAKGDTRQNDGS